MTISRKFLSVFCLRFFPSGLALHAFGWTDGMAPSKILHMIYNMFVKERDAALLHSSHRWLRVVLRFKSDLE